MTAADELVFRHNGDAKMLLTTAGHLKVASDITAFADLTSYDGALMMGVNGGAGNTISFSEIQTFYGGSNPISISEYYRGGSEVPTDLIPAQANTNGTSDQTLGQFTADVTSTSAFTGSLSNGSFTSGSISIQSDTAKVEIYNNHPDEDGGSSRLTTTVSVGGSSVGSFNTFDSTGNGALILACTIAGPANNGAVSSPNVDGHFRQVL